MSGGEADVSLLGTVRADEGVNLNGLDLVESVDGALNLGLCGTRVDEEGEGVVLLDLLHGHVSDERVADNAELVPRGLDDLSVGVGLVGLGAAVGVRAAELRASVRLALRDADDLLGGGSGGGLLASGGTLGSGDGLLGGLVGDGGDGSLGSVSLGSHCV